MRKEGIAVLWAGAELSDRGREVVAVTVSGKYSGPVTVLLGKKRGLRVLTRSYPCPLSTTSDVILEDIISLQYYIWYIWVNFEMCTFGSLNSIDCKDRSSKEPPCMANVIARKTGTVLNGHKKRFIVWTCATAKYNLRRLMMRSDHPTWETGTLPIWPPSSTPWPPPHPSCGQRQEVAGWQDGGDAADFTEKARARGDVGRPFDFSLSWHFSASIVPIIVLLVLWKIKNEWMPKSISKSIQRLTQGQTTFCLRWREEANSAYHRFLIQVAILVDLRFVRSDTRDCSRWFPSIEARPGPLFAGELLVD